MKYKHLITLLILAWFVTFSASAQDELEAYERRQFVHGNDTLPYRILYPENYKPDQKYPLILVLHGAGERGRNNESQLVHGAKLFLKPEYRQQYPAIVVFPQCPPEDYWSNVNIVYSADSSSRTFNYRKGGSPTRSLKAVMELVEELEKFGSIDKRRMYLGGLSMGGMGTFELLRRKPDTFAAAFPICGGGHPAGARKYAKKVSLWVFHGEEDGVVPVEKSTVMVEAIRKAGGDVKYTVYPGVNHNSWDYAFAEPELLSWLFSHRK
ncbi:prolyl oligopeptidase family serine peptidase [Pontibacter ruber]|uniref:Prolyl oligopeptidase family serine peptidase n=1 Tax=Pontibacter ruber TaxID=1343895 RepID=A0ABW5CS93_9BACT|nr:prolyl oligopeptidase family serine peptidase [Pontibacter ruber]